MSSADFFSVDRLGALRLVEVNPQKCGAGVRTVFTEIWQDHFSIMGE